MGLEGDGDAVAFDLDAAHEFSALLDMDVAHDVEHDGGHSAGVHDGASRDGDS